MSVRWYRSGAHIPGVGVVLQMSDTAYLVSCDRDGLERWVPFYGPNGVHTAELRPVSPLVTFGGEL